MNPAQAQGVAHRGSSLLVLAGAGTGKTRVITHRVASLLAEVGFSPAVAGCQSVAWMSQ